MVNHSSHIDANPLHANIGRKVSNGSLNESAKKNTRGLLATLRQNQPHPHCQNSAGLRQLAGARPLRFAAGILEQAAGVNIASDQAEAPDRAAQSA
jgi:hypothetical protein